MNDLLKRIQARASNPATIIDCQMPAGYVQKIGPKATPEDIAATESALGFRLPELFKQIYQEIGSGGFGPGYGLIGAHGGHADFKGNRLAELAAQLGAKDRRIVPICNWGCGIYSCLDCSHSEAPVFIFDPNRHALDPKNLISVSVTSAATGETRKVFESKRKAPRPAIITPVKLDLLPHKPSFREFISDWADGRSLWDEIKT